MCAACSATDWRTVPRSLGEFEIRRRISPIADNSLVSRAASDSWLAADESRLRGRADLVPPRRFGAAGLRRRGLTDPDSERRLMASPQGFRAAATKRL